jgi:hypothetical protein
LVKRFFVAIGNWFISVGRSIRSFFVWIGWKLGFCDLKKSEAQQQVRTKAEGDTPADQKDSVAR